MNKTLSVVFIILLILFGIFFTIISVLTLIYIPIDLSSYSYDVSVKGFIKLIGILNPYVSIITLSITIFAIYLAIRQLKIAEDANLIPKRTEWTSSLKSEIFTDLSEPYINNFFINNLEDIFNWIYKQNSKMTIENVTQVNRFYQKFIYNNIFDLIKNSSEFGRYKDSDLRINYTLESVNRIINSSQIFKRISSTKDSVSILSYFISVNIKRVIVNIFYSISNVFPEDI